MRICLVGPTSPYRGGISHYHTLLAEALNAAGVDVRVFNFTRMYPERLFPGKSQLDESQHTIGMDSERTLDSVDPRSWRRTGKAIAASNPDRVVFQWWHPFFAPAFAGVSFWVRRHSPNTRRIFLCHNVKPHESTVLDAALLRAAYASADAFVVHAEQERSALHAWSTSRPITVHPHPVYRVFRKGNLTREEARQQLGLTGDVLLFFGYVRQYKGLHLALEALPQILSRRNVTLVVAGEFYEDRATYERQIRNLGIEKHVRLVDRYIANEEVETYFVATDLVVQPYLHATQSGISQVAFGFGRPVLATSVGGLPDAIRDGETGLLVPPGEPVAIANAVCRFFDDKLGPSMEASISGASERFGWDSLARVVCEV